MPDFRRERSMAGRRQRSVAAERSSQNAWECMGSPQANHLSMHWQASAFYTLNAWPRQGCPRGLLLDLPASPANWRARMRDPRLMADLRGKKSATEPQPPCAAIRSVRGPAACTTTATRHRYGGPGGAVPALADRLPAIVAPSFASARSQPNTGGGISFPGTTSFDGAAFSACVRDIVRDLVRQGVKSIALINGNYENTYFAIEGIDLALRDCGPSAQVKVLNVNWWSSSPPRSWTMSSAALSRVGG